MSSARRFAPSILALSGLLASCSGDELTENVVIVDSDLAVPGALDEISIIVAGASGIPKTARAVLSGASAVSLPVTLGLRPRTTGGPPVTIGAEHAAWKPHMRGVCFAMPSAAYSR